MLLFDPNNLRYVTSTAIGTWERDKNIRFALVPPGCGPEATGVKPENMQVVEVGDVRSALQQAARASAG